MDISEVAAYPMPGAEQPVGNRVDWTPDAERADVAGPVGVAASVSVHDVTRCRVPSGVHATAATLPPKGTADRIIRHLPQTMLRTTEVLTGRTGMMTSASSAARRPG